MKVTVRRKAFPKAALEGAERKLLEQKDRSECRSRGEGVRRILLFLGVGAIYYGFCVCVLVVTLTSFDAYKVILAAIEGSPTMAAVLLIAGYLVFLLLFACLVKRRLRRR